MRRIFLMLSLLVLCLMQSNARKIYADLSEDQTIGKGTWTAATQTFEWTASTNARMVLEGLEGDLTNCSSLVLQTFDYTASFRVDFVCEEGTIQGNRSAGTAFFSAGTKTIDLKTVFAEHLDWLSSVKQVRLNTNSGAGTIKLSQAFLVQPLSALVFDEKGVATVDFTDLMVSDASFDEVTGVLTSENGKGALAICLPGEGIDMSEVARLVVDYEGDNIVNNLQVATPDDNLTKAYNSKYNLDMAQYGDKTQHINKIVWNIGTAGSMTIKSIQFLSQTATGIQQVSASGKQAEQPLYNLAGMRISRAKGIIVSNGKKYIVK